jgi:hypothetical protein
VAPAIGWHADVGDDLFEAVAEGCLHQAWRLLLGGDDVALAEQRLVLSDHDAHGSSAWTLVPVAPLVILRVPPRTSTRSRSPLSPEPAVSVRTPPRPSSTTSMDSVSPSRRRDGSTLRASACLMTLVSASAAMKYAVLSTGRRQPGR